MLTNNVIDRATLERYCMMLERIHMLFTNKHVEQDANITIPFITIFFYICFAYIFLYTPSYYYGVSWCWFLLISDLANLFRHYWKVGTKIIQECLTDTVTRFLVFPAHACVLINGHAYEIIARTNAWGGQLTISYNVELLWNFIRLKAEGVWEFKGCCFSCDIVTWTSHSRVLAFLP